MYRRLSCVGLPTAALAAHLSSSLSARADAAPPSSHPLPPPRAQQWLWSTSDGVSLYRDDDSGETVYVGAAGEVLPARPEGVAPEAYAHRWRRSQPWEDASEVAAARSNKKRGASRHVLLVRHAAYHVEARDDAQRLLTDLGEEQCVFLAERLRALHDASDGFFKALALNSITTSALTRAIQTSRYITPLLPDAEVSRDADLNEGRPCLPEPAPSHASHYTNQGGDAERIERAYRRICARPPSTQYADSCEVIVCHANVIRYVVCRALQLPPEAWLRFSLPHASITHLVVRSSGHTSLRALGDAGHLPPHLLSY